MIVLLVAFVVMLPIPVKGKNGYILLCLTAHTII